MLDFLTNPTYERAQQATAAQPGWWVHWRYSEDEWQRWREADWARTRRVYHRWQLGGLGVVGLLAAVALALLLTGKLTTFWSILLPLIWVLGVGVGANWLFWLRGPYAQAKRLYALRQHGPREIAINPLWLWQAGEGVPLIRTMHALTWVYLRGDNPVILAFRLTNRGRRNNIYEVWVPVPGGGEVEARQLIERFKKEILRKPGWMPLAPVVTTDPGGSDTTRLPPLLGPTAEQETQRLS